MPLLTTTIGSYPKPDYVPVPGWYDNREIHQGQPTRTYTDFLEAQPHDAAELFDRATREVVREQVELGIDIPTDGEVRREHYIYYHLRQLRGFDFDHLSVKGMRQGGWRAEVPRVVAKLSAGAPFLVRDWQLAEEAAGRPVKMTVPGPLTIMDSTADEHYGDRRELAIALAEVLGVEIRRLAEAGCRWIQVDEPLLARYPDLALDLGIEALARCFHGVPEGVNRGVHICCGYPSELDEEGYPKADPGAYFDLADALEASPVDVVSLEDAHRPGDLALLERFPTKTIIFGVIGIARRRVETVDEIRARLLSALEHIDAHRLLAGPDCGLIMLERATAKAKLSNLVEAARGIELSSGGGIVC